jgi:formamidopyrimidine-DNA glycosylase
MPELPEVEIVKRSLEKILGPNIQILGAEVRRKDIRFEIPKNLVEKVLRQNVLSIRRRAKYLLFDMSSGVLLNHLGMTGSWRVLLKGEDLGVHDHFVLHLSDGKTLVFRDPRRFGMLDFFDIADEFKNKRLKDLGPEPLDQETFTAEYLFLKTRKRVTAIKTFIMNQNVVVGVGNIYASEALFMAKVNPLKKAKRLSQKECRILVHSIAKVLENAIELGGSTIRDFVSSDGVYGNYQDQFAVYGRAGQDCKVCSTRLKSKVITGRSTFWCPKCQKA